MYDLIWLYSISPSYSVSTNGDYRIKNQFLETYWMSAWIMLYFKSYLSTTRICPYLILPSYSVITKGDYRIKTLDVFAWIMYMWHRKSFFVLPGECDFAESPYSVSSKSDCRILKSVCRDLLHVLVQIMCMSHCKSYLSTSTWLCCISSSYSNSTNSDA